MYPASQQPQFPDLREEHGPVGEGSPQDPEHPYNQPGETSMIIHKVFSISETDSYREAQKSTI
jgi:hypothetical protein